MTHLVRLIIQAELAQSLIKPCFFGRYSVGQCRGDKFVKGQKLVHRHRFEIIRFHFFKPRWFVVLGGCFRRRANSGRFRAASMVEEGQNWVSDPHTYSTILQRPTSLSTRGCAWMKWRRARRKTHAKPSQGGFRALGRLWRHDATSGGLPNGRFGVSFSGCPERSRTCRFTISQFRSRICEVTGVTTCSSAAGGSVQP